MENYNPETNLDCMDLGHAGDWCKVLGEDEDRQTCMSHRTKHLCLTLIDAWY